VVEAAKEEFWEEGFERTGISDLERATGLNRSSLYQAFGSKRSVFEAALEAYVADFVDPRVVPMEGAGAGLAEIETFFTDLARHFGEPSSQRGCLWVNSVGELSGRSTDVDVRGPEFHERLHAAFRNALGNTFGVDPVAEQRLDDRARILTAATFGVWLTARIDPATAVHTCHAVVADLESWARVAR
jgi:AcrR family transcriptional regulator